MSDRSVLIPRNARFKNNLNEENESRERRYTRARIAHFDPGERFGDWLSLGALIFQVQLCFPKIH